MKRTVFVLTALGLVAAWAAPAQAQRPMRVVATLSTFADLVKQIGGDRVEVSSVASPRFNPHFIEPKPSDVLKVKRADLFVHAGLDLELWRWPLVDAAGNPDVRPGRAWELDLSKGVRLLEVPDRPVSRAEGDIHLYGNPHYWLGPANGKAMARAIAEKLSELDPERAPRYRERLEQFLKQLDERIAQWGKQAAAAGGKELIGYHNEWVYLTEFLGVKIEKFLEPKPGIPPTPQQILLLEQRIRANQIPAILQASFMPTAASRQLAKRTGVRVVTLCQNVGEKPECGDYLEMLDYNIQQIVRMFDE